MDLYGTIKFLSIHSVVDCFRSLHMNFPFFSNFSIFSCCGREKYSTAMQSRVETRKIQRKMYAESNPGWWTSSRYSFSQYRSGWWVSLLFSPNPIFCKRYLYNCTLGRVVQRGFQRSFEWYFIYLTLIYMWARSGTVNAKSVSASRSRANSLR